MQTPLASPSEDSGGSSLTIMPSALGTLGYDVLIHMPSVSYSLGEQYTVHAASNTFSNGDGVFYDQEISFDFGVSYTSITVPMVQPLGTWELMLTMDVVLTFNTGTGLTGSR